MMEARRIYKFIARSNVEFDEVLHLVKLWEILLILAVILAVISLYMASKYLIGVIFRQLYIFIPFRFF